MQYYSTNHQSPNVSLQDAVTHGLSPDRGLYMPERIPMIPKAFFNNIAEMSLTDIAYVVANTLFGEEIDSETLKQIVNETLNFEIPLKHVTENRYVLELFHGPTLAFKDIGARFMARLLAYFNKRNGQNRIVNVLVATSGDTGSAVANGFLNIPGIRVFVLYPKGKVSPLQEAQFTTLGGNITAFEVKGTFDDCQALVKKAFVDDELNNKMVLTSANSINVARFLPQMFYYFHAYAQLAKNGKALDKIVVSVPSGNFGNLAAGLIAKRMGLPIFRFIAANNANDVFYKYLQTGEYTPKASIATIANAMDVGAPSNFDRIIDLYNGSHAAISADISGYSYADELIAQTICDTYRSTGYLLDPHGAVAYRALTQNIQHNEIGIFLETAHPAKFKETVESIIGGKVSLPAKLAQFANGEKQTIKISTSYSSFKKQLLSTIQ
jgi:threonine synthase